MGMSLKRGLGNDADEFNTVWVYDTAAFPYYKGEVYHQNHCNFFTSEGMPYPDAYTVDIPSQTFSNLRMPSHTFSRLLTPSRLLRLTCTASSRRMAGMRRRAARSSRGLTLRAQRARLADEPRAAVKRSRGATREARVRQIDG